MKPLEIENLSFRIIDQEAGAHGYDNAHWPVVRRVIHTSADFEYIKTMSFHPRAVTAALAVIQKGATIVTDTNMARVGIRKKEISKFGGKVTCLIADEAVAKRAEAEGITRAVAAVDKAVEQFDNPVYVVGNAPTALLRIIELVKEKRISPPLIIGMPVGFVNAAESKDALMELDIPFISNRGRKGGSNVAAAIVNALAIMAAA